MMALAPQVSVRVVGDVHRAALPAAVAGLLPEQFGEHPAGVSPRRGRGGSR